MAPGKLHVVALAAAVAAATGLAFVSPGAPPTVHADHGTGQDSVVALPEFEPRFSAISRYPDVIGTSPLYSADAVAVNSNYVVVSTNGEVHKYDEAGRHAGRSDSIPFAVDIALSPTHMYVTSGWGATMLDLAGNAVSSFSGSDARGITTNSTHVLVARSDFHEISIYDMTGDYVGAFGSKGAGPGQLRFPYGVEYNSTHIFVTESFNNRVQIFDLSGNHEGMFGSHGTAPGHFDSPRGIAVSPTHIFVADSNNNRIQVFDPSGGYVGAFNSKNPSGVALSTTHLFVAEPDYNRVRVIKLPESYAPPAPTPALTDVFSAEYVNGTLRVLDAHGAAAGTLGTNIGVSVNSTHIIVADGGGRTLAFALPAR